MAFITTIKKVSENSGRYTYNTLYLPDVYELGDLEGWFKRVKRAVRKGISQPLKIVGAVVAPPLMLVSKKTRGRILRRVGGVITGAGAGFLTGNVAGAMVGGLTGGLKAKKGVKGIKGYGRIGLVSAATGFVAGGVAGAAGYGKYGGLGAKAYSLGASKVSSIYKGITADKAIAAADIAKEVADAVVKPIPQTGSDVIMRVSIVPEIAPSGEQYMSMLRHTGGVIPDTGGIFPPMIAPATAGTWGGGSGQFMPELTGSNIPGQEPTITPTPVKAGVIEIDIKTLALMGAMGLVLIMAYKK